MGGVTIRLSGISSLADGEARVFAFRRGDVDEQAFLLRLGDDLVAYVNRCPHWNVDLDLGDERFYAADLDRIYCKNHGALFLPRTGECVVGPCVGSRLEPLAVVVEGDAAVVTALRLEVR